MSEAEPAMATPLLVTRGYQQEMLDESLRRNIIIALDTGSGKTHIAVLRLKHEMENQTRKLSWFVAPTVALCGQQSAVLKSHIPVSIGLVSGANEPGQWKSSGLWERVLQTHRIMVSTPQVLLDALRHGYIDLGRDISLLIFDEAHHAVDNHPYNRIMKEFYFVIPLEGRDAAAVRPTVLGLTASPIYGGNVAQAFRTIEGNLDCTISAPRRYQDELERYVHRPIFRHVVYYSNDVPFSTNVAAVVVVVETMDIKDDPKVAEFKEKLKRLHLGSPEYSKYDQRLSKVIQTQDTFSHKGLRQFRAAAEAICEDLGAWAADWFVWKVLEHAKKAANPFNNIMASWKVSEKAYLARLLDKINVNPVSYYPDDIADDCTDKVKVLLDCLLLEKAEAESLDEVYSGIIFVQRRDAVLALAEILKRHPSSSGVFNIGVLLGTSDSSHRHSMMDITKHLAKEETQEETLAEFKDGEKNLIVATAVAEEGLDIQACGSVIRWDLPQNMASWAQSRGRARKKRSTFTMMFQEGTKQAAEIVKWEQIEKQMRELIYHSSRELVTPNEDVLDDGSEEADDLVYEVPSTGAKLTLHSAISHLTHFCAVIPNSSHADNRPLFERDPPEFPDGWHSLPPGPERSLTPFQGPYGSILTLPRTLPLAERRFSVGRVYRSVISAHRHAAFEAYLEMYHQKLLTEHLLPIASVLDPELEDEVKAMLADVEKREGLTNVSFGIDPWTASGGGGDDDDDEGGQLLFCSLLTFEGLEPLYLFTRSQVPPFDLDQGPTLYRKGLAPVRMSCSSQAMVAKGDVRVSQARDFTRRVFWGLNAARMDWDNLDFSYLFLPAGTPDPVWDSRRTWLEEASAADPGRYPHHLMTRARDFGEEFGYPDDITFVQRHIGFGSPWRFVGWRYDVVSPEEELELGERYAYLTDIDITYPLLVVERFPSRTNFLVPIPPPKESKDEVNESFRLLLLPRHSAVIFLSPEEAEYSFLLPSLLRFLSAMMTANSLRKSLFFTSSRPLYEIPLSLLVVAMTAPSSGEQNNYQRLETLGDAVLKFFVGVQLMGEYPLWHEGYLTKKKDHAVANVRLAKEDLKRGLYRWIIREAMPGRRWKPRYFSSNASVSPVEERTDLFVQVSASEADGSPAIPPSDNLQPVEEIGEWSSAGPTKPKKKTKKSQQLLSTKILADVVESTIGAAYLHGGIPLGYECVKFFDLGLRWEPIPNRIHQILACADSITRDGEPLIPFPPVLQDVEHMLGYAFERKILLIEALTHASYQNDGFRTSSYERMEFLGDSILDLVVNDYLFHAPGKNYSPGHIFLRKSAMVNAHLLAYVCLNTFRKVEKFMPRPNPETGVIEEIREEQEICLSRCLLHSSPRVLEDLVNVQSRFRKTKDEIEEALTGGTIFPWAALTRLQAPKFLSDIVESLIGAVYLDSFGEIEIVKGVMGRLGIMAILEHMVIGNVDVLHPVSRLSMWAQSKEKDIEYDIRKEGGKVCCRIFVDGVEMEAARVSDGFRGKASEEQVKFAACEKAIKELRLRDSNVGDKIKKRKTRPKKKRGKGKGTT